MPVSFIRRLTKRFLIFVNIAVGLLFLGGAFVKGFDPEDFWFLSLLVLILPYLILFLVLLFFLWLFVKPLWALLPVLFLFIGRSAVVHVIPLRLSAPFSMEKEESSIRIMSWNVEQFNIQNYKKDPEGLDRMIDLINEFQPDIACLQEVVAGEKQEAVNYYPDILKKLDFDEEFFAYQLINDFDRNHHFGTIILSKFPVVRKQFMVNNPDDYNSTFQYVDVLAGTDTIRIFNVHLQSLKFSKENREYLDSLHLKNPSASESLSIIGKIKRGVLRRAVQARFVKDEMNHTPHPTILCGDFNDVPVSYAYEIIGKDMQNAFVKKGAGLSRTFDGIAPTLRIDNIFADSTFEVVQYKRIKRSLSDHFPIIADVKLRIHK